MLLSHTCFFYLCFFFVFFFVYQELHTKRQLKESRKKRQNSNKLIKCGAFSGVCGSAHIMFIACPIVLDGGDLKKHRTLFFLFPLAPLFYVVYYSLKIMFMSTHFPFNQCKIYKIKISFVYRSPKKNMYKWNDSYILHKHKIW